MAGARRERGGRHASGARPSCLPDWLTRPAEAERVPAIVSPSTAFADPVPGMVLAGKPEDRRRALMRGVLVHRLLQSLPDVPPERRAAAARQYLARAAAEFTRRRTRRNCSASRWPCSITRRSRRWPHRAAGPRCRSSAASCATGARPSLISGQVDRLVVTDEAVLIADYKTNRPAAAAIRSSSRALSRRSSPRTGRCSRHSTRTAPCGPPWSGPMCLISWRFPARPWTPRWPASGRREHALTLSAMVHTFADTPRMRRIPRQQNEVFPWALGRSPTRRSRPRS